MFRRQFCGAVAAWRRQLRHNSLADGDRVCRQGFAELGEVGPSQRLEQYCAFIRLQLGPAETSERVERHSKCVWRVPGPRESCGKSEELVPVIHKWFGTVPSVAAQWRGQPVRNDLWLCRRLEDAVYPELQPFNPAGTDA